MKKFLDVLAALVLLSILIGMIYYGWEIILASLVAIITVSIICWAAKRISSRY